MLKNEAVWIGNELGKLPLKKGMKVLNVGSSTLDFRKNEQPYIHAEIFQPMYDGDIEVIHLDIKQDEGVDLVGDLTDKNFISKLKEQKIDVVICSNLLEHLTNRGFLIDALNEILPENGFVIITVPYRFPFHKDPIDTMYRPSVEQLAGLFPSMKMVSGDEVKEPDTSYFKTIKVNYKVFLSEIARTFVPFVFAGGDWPSLVRYLPHWGKNYSATSLVLQKSKKSN